jgi:hypothetical protein
MQKQVKMQMKLIFKKLNNTKQEKPKPKRAQSAVAGMRAPIERNIKVINLKANEDISDVESCNLYSRLIGLSALNKQKNKSTVQLRNFKPADTCN